MEPVLQGLMMVVAWPAAGWLVAGVFFGATPGLSGLVGLAILLPFTYDMSGASAFSFLLGMYAITTTSDTLASVLLGVPGTGASQATILDGYPLAMKGEAARPPYSVAWRWTWTASGPSSISRASTRTACAACSIG